MLEILQQSPFAWAILAIVTIASLVYAIICQHKNKKSKGFSYIVESNEVIQNNKDAFDKLEIFYAGKVIDSLCVSDYTIWNNGNTQITAYDMATGKELTVSVSDSSKILEANIVGETEESNGFSITSINEQSKKLTFDYAEPKDGVIIRVIHTGNMKDVGLSGKIKGGKLTNVLDVNISKNLFKSSIISIYTFIISIILFLCVTAMIVANLLIWRGIITDEVFIKIYFWPGFSSTATIVPLAVLFLMSTFMLYFSTAMMKKILKVGIPKKLKKSFIIEKTKESVNDG